eukprot:1110399-Prymnesium_polylepis.2
MPWLGLAYSTAMNTKTRLGIRLYQLLVTHPMSTMSTALFSALLKFFEASLQQHEFFSELHVLVALPTSSHPKLPRTRGV